MNLIHFLKSISIYILKSRWLFLLLFFVAIFILIFDLNGHIGIQDKRNSLWSPILEHYVAFGTFIVAFAAWFSTVKRDWKERLPKRLSVEFSYDKKIVMLCHYAYLSGESDIRQVGQQIGAQISNCRTLSFNAANIEWEEKDIIFHEEQILKGDRTFFEKKLPFRHYIVHYELFDLPDDGKGNENLEKNYCYIWSPPFKVDLQGKKDKLKYNQKQLFNTNE